MVSIPKYYVRKSGSDYALIGFNKEELGNQSVDSASFVVTKSSGGNLSVGDDVSIGYYDGAVWNDYFKGDIVRKSSHETAVFTMQGYGGRVSRAAHFSMIYDDKSPEYIVENIIDNQVSSLTYSSSTVTGITISRFVVRDETPAEAIKRLVDLTGLQIRTDSDKKFYFETAGYTTNPNKIEIGVNSFLKSSWNRTPNALVNSLMLIGGDALFDTSESFTATAGQTEFVVSDKIAGNVKVTDNGTEVVGGSGDTTSSYDYEVDFDNKKITFVSGRVAGHTIIVNYTYSIPIKITATDEDSISTHGVHSKKVTDNSIKTMSDARKRAGQILSDYSGLTNNTTIRVSYSIVYHAGETVQVVDSFNGINQQFQIKKVSLSYPSGEKIVEVGNVVRLDLVDWNRGLDERLKKLESKQDNSDRIQQYRNVKESINVKLVNGRVRVRTNTLGHSWIVGSSSNGIVGTNTSTQDGSQQVVGGAGRSETVVSVTNVGDKFIERFNFSTYVDSGNTTATVDTSNEEVTFTVGEVLQSLACFKGGSTISKATLTADSITNLTFAMRTDSNAWESVNSGSEHTFTNSGTELSYKVTATGTTSLSNITITIT